MARTPASIDDVIERLRAFARHKGWRKSRFAAEAGLTDTTLRGFDSPGWNPRADTLRRLEAVVPPEFQAAQDAGADRGAELQAHGEMSDDALEAAARLVEEIALYDALASNARRKRDREDHDLRRQARAELRAELACKLRGRKGNRATDVLVVLGRLAALDAESWHDVHLVDAWPLAWMGLVDIEAVLRCNSNSVPPQIRYKITLTNRGRAALAAAPAS